MTYPHLSPMVKLVEKIYPTGVHLSHQAMAALDKRLLRLPALPKWFVQIVPQPH